jgi:hypothetical protein
VTDDHGERGRVTEAEVDWDAGVRRERRRDAVSVLPVSGWIAGILLLRRDWVAPDIAPEIALLAGLGVGLVVLVVTVTVRSAWTDTYRMQHAIREYVDPGPGLRAKTDRFAEKRSWRWYPWSVPFWALYLCMDGRWDMPALAVPGAALLLASGTAAVLVWRRFAESADRWLADPPGPAREPDPESRRSAQRELTVFFVVSGVALVALFVIALVTG